MADDVKFCTPIPCPSFNEATLTVEATSEVDQLAGRAYKAYMSSLEHRDVLYESLPPRLKAAWHAAVCQVISDTRYHDNGLPD